MKKSVFISISVLFFIANSYAEEFPVQSYSANTVENNDTFGQLPDINNPEYFLPSKQQQESPQNLYFGNKTDRPVSTHKVNYFSINNWPDDNNSQVKFQISLKFRILEPNLYILKYNLFPAYFAYTQKSLWNKGEKSEPVEESNYNPEFFLDYPVNLRIFDRIKLRNIIICPFEHESNGLADFQSRSWNRQYIQVNFGLESDKKLEITNSLLSDKALLYIKLWYASDYSSQDEYLQAKGFGDKFFDYMGKGEVGISIRNFLWGGDLKSHQMDLTIPIFTDKHEDTCKFELRQQLPNMNFAIYIQYWYGYGETLSRFDKFGHRSFVGFSFSY